MKKKYIIPVAVVATGAVVARMISKRRNNKSVAKAGSSASGSTRAKRSRRSARPSRAGR